jgi:hypothetical protein
MKKNLYLIILNFVLTNFSIAQETVPGSIVSYQPAAVKNI